MLPNMEDVDIYLVKLDQEFEKIDSLPCFNDEKAICGSCPNRNICKVAFNSEECCLGIPF